MCGSFDLNGGGIKRLLISNLGQVMKGFLAVGLWYCSGLIRMGLGWGIWSELWLLQVGYLYCYYAVWYCTSSACGPKVHGPRENLFWIFSRQVGY